MPVHLRLKWVSTLVSLLNQWSWTEALPLPFSGLTSVQSIIYIVPPLTTNQSIGIRLPTPPTPSGRHTQCILD